MTPARERLLRIVLAMPEAGVTVIAKSIGWICPGLEQAGRPMMRQDAQRGAEKGRRAPDPRAGGTTLGRSPPWTDRDVGAIGQTFAIGAQPRQEVVPEVWKAAIRKRDRSNRPRSVRRRLQLPVILQALM
jgi:hypothetical protein